MYRQINQLWDYIPGGGGGVGAEGGGDDLVPSMPQFVCVQK